MLFNFGFEFFTYIVCFVVVDLKVKFSISFLLANKLQIFRRPRIYLRTGFSESSPNSQSSWNRKRTTIKIFHKFPKFIALQDVMRLFRNLILAWLYVQKPFLRYYNINQPLKRPFSKVSTIEEIEDIVGLKVKKWKRNFRFLLWKMHTYSKISNFEAKKDLFMHKFFWKQS